MTVSISAIVAQSNAFASSQLQQFQQFINTSKALQGAIATEQAQSQQLYTQLLQLVNSLQQGAAANGLQPIQILQSDQAYCDALSAETVPASGFNLPKQSLKYMDSFMQQVDQDMNQREHTDE
ncbi:hypothetical protein ACFO3I_14315 [Rheinheimera marina]|uniref:Uncharacterized protein n=1 Tax=Rheinheimera marina TaxID=1774958 RepID=A0ABV9JPK1_9GAMM